MKPSVKRQEDDYRIRCEGSGTTGCDFHNMSYLRCQMCNNYYSKDTYTLIPEHTRLDVLRMIEDGVIK